VADLTLQRTPTGDYELAGIGSIRELKGAKAELQAGEVIWRLRRPGQGFSLSVEAVDANSKPVARIVGRNLRGGTVTTAGRTLVWRSKRVFSSRFNLIDGDETLAAFAPGRGAEPVRVTLHDPTRVDPLVLLLCCYVMLGVQAAA